MTIWDMYFKQIAWRLILVALLLFLAGMFTSGCASLGGIRDVFKSNPRQKATRTPLYVYRGDLAIETDGKEFDGVGVLEAKEFYDLKVKSQIRLDRVEVESCGRSDVCQNGKVCRSTFDVEGGWFGSVGKKMKYRYVPAEHEKDCSIYIKAFDKRVLAAWGYLGIRPKDNHLPAQVVCNGIAQNFTGHSVCQSKEGLAQRISFAVDIEDFEADKHCGIKKISSRLFELIPTLGKCGATFYGGGHWFTLELFAYDTVFVRGE